MKRKKGEEKKIIVTTGTKKVVEMKKKKKNKTHLLQVKCFSERVHARALVSVAGLKNWTTLWSILLLLNV